MHLQDLDIETGQRFRRLLHQRREQIDAQTHIAGFDDHGMARGGADFRFIVGGKSRRADHMDDARLRRERRQFDRDFAAS